MENLFDEFKKTLLTFVTTLYNFYENDKIQKFIDSYDRLDMVKIMDKFNTGMKEYVPMLAVNVELNFDHKFMILPGIDMHTIWINTTQGQKKIIKTSLHKLYVMSSIIIAQRDDKIQNDTHNIVSNSTSIDSHTNNNTTQEQPLPFNPYIGILGQNTNTAPNLDIGNLIDGNIKLPTPVEATGDGLAGLSGLPFNMESLNEQLKNLDKKDIDDASEKVTQMLGKNVDPSVSNMLTDILHNIGNELKNTDLTSGNTFSNITKLAENVAQKMMPQLNDNPENVQKLLMSTQSIANDWGLAKSGIDPFAMMGNLMSQISKDGLPGGMTNINNISNNTTPATITQNNVPVNESVSNTKNEQSKNTKNKPRQRKQKKNKPTPFQPLDLSKK